MFHPRKMGSFFVSAAALLLFSACSFELTEEERTKLLSLDVPTQPADISLDLLIRKMQMKIDPQKTFEKTNSFIMQHEIVSEEEFERLTSAPTKVKHYYIMTIYFQKPDSIKIVNTENGRAISTILYKDGKAWTIPPDAGKAVPIPEGRPLDLITTYVRMMRPDLTLKDIFQSVELSETRDKKGKRLYRLVCQTEKPGIAPYVIYVNADTFLTEKCQTIMYSNDGSQHLYTATSEDYKPMSGVLLPAKSIITSGKRNEIDMVTGFAINPAFPASTFKP